MNRFFADVSNYQPNPDFAVYRHKGGHFLIGLKASEGRTFTDATHSGRVQAAHDHGVHVIHYHFARPESAIAMSANEQAQHFWEVIKPHFGRRDYACLDIEVTGGLTVGQVNAWVQAFDRHFRVISGHQLIGYSYEAFMNEHGKGMQVKSKKWWIAAYGQKPKVSWVRAFWAWQFTNGETGPAPHHTAGVGSSDISILNRASALWLRRPYKKGNK